MNCRKMSLGSKDPSVVGEQAEHNPYQEQLQIVAAVAGFLQGIVQTGHQFGSFDVDRILIPERPALHPDDEPELLHMLRQVRERESGLLPLVAVKQLEGLEVTEQLKPGLVPFRQGVEVGARLNAGLLQVPTCALLFDQQDTGPEQVDETA